MTNELRAPTPEEVRRFLDEQQQAVPSTARAPFSGRGQNVFIQSRR